MMDSNTPIWQLTIGEFRDLLRNELSEHSTNAKIEPPHEIVKGIHKMAERLGIGYTTLCDYKKRGMFDGCYTQIGRTIMFDVNRVIEAQMNIKRKK